MLPTQGEVVGVAHPVVVTFSAPVADRLATERAIDIKSAPAMTGKFEWLDNDVVQWVPDRFWPAHSTVALSVGGLATNFANGSGRRRRRQSLRPHVHREHRRSRRGTASHYRRRTTDPTGERTGVFPASMGRPEYPTPVGTYTVLAKERSVTMDSSSVGIPVDAPDGYLLTVDYAVRFTSRGLFVHSAPWAVNSMGYDNVSHGCISLSPEDAEWYYNTVNVGDPVIVQENSIEVPREVSPPVRIS